MDLGPLLIRLEPFQYFNRRGTQSLTPGVDPLDYAQGLWQILRNLGLHEYGDYTLIERHTKVQFPAAHLRTKRRAADEEHDVLRTFDQILKLAPPIFTSTDIVLIERYPRPVSLQTCDEPRSLILVPPGIRNEGVKERFIAISRTPRWFGRASRTA